MCWYVDIKHILLFILLVVLAHAYNTYIKWLDIIVVKNYPQRLQLANLLDWWVIVGKDLCISSPQSGTKTRKLVDDPHFSPASTGLLFSTFYPSLSIDII